MKTLYVVNAVLPVKSVTVLLEIPLGSRDEPKGLDGVAHLLEHLLPTGPSFVDLSFEDWVETIGGYSNASTGMESMSIWAKVPSMHGAGATALLLDCIGSPNITPEGVDREREVIMEEVADLTTDHYERANESLLHLLFPRHPLGRAVGGSPRSLRGISDDDVKMCWERAVCAVGGVLAVVGEREGVEGALQAVYASGLSGVQVPEQPIRTVPRNLVNARVATSPKSPTRGYVVIGGRAVPHLHELWAAFYVLSALMGSSPRSLLFRRIRTELRLTYDISANVTSFTDCGAWSVAISCSLRNVAAVRDIVGATLECLSRHDVPVEAIEEAKERTRGQLALAYDSPLFRAQMMTGAILEDFYGDPFVELQCGLERVTLEMVGEAAEQVLRTLVFAYR